jgi:hypothetical protein
MFFMVGAIALSVVERGRGEVTNLCLCLLIARRKPRRFHLLSIHETLNSI